MDLSKKSSKSKKFIYLVSLFVLFSFIVGSFIMGGISFYTMKEEERSRPSSSPNPLFPPNRSLKEWEEEARRFPRDSFILHRYAQVLLGTGKLDEAEKAAKKAVKLAPGDPLNYELLGQIQLERGQAQEAIEQIRKALRLKPDNPVFQFELTQAEEAAKKNEARHILRKP